MSSNAPAEVGNHQGAIISVVMTSGTNQAQGTVFGFLRDDALNAAGWASRWQPCDPLNPRAKGEIRQLTDAGGGNVTGAWGDLGRFKTPTLRGLAARAPYFHNGIAATLDEVIRHYEVHLGFIFTDEERADLAAFLSAL